MNILFVWTGLTSYMGDCWRELAKSSGVRLKVCVAVNAIHADSTAFRKEDVLRGLDAIVVEDTASQVEAVQDMCREMRPDVIFAVGWHSPVCRAVVESAAWSNVPKVCAFDMPWRWKLRCLVAPLVLGRRLKHYAAAYVPGQVCERYAKWLGFKKVFKGLFSIDTRRFTPGGARSEKKYFLYIGRYSPEKRLDVLAKAYQIYRDRGGRLPLMCYGKGEATKELRGVEGITVNDFVSPSEVPSLYHQAVSFVLTSDFDPWPLVLLEAMSAGCRIIASDRCMNRPELGASWIVFPHGDPEALARELLVMEKRTSDVTVPEVVDTYDCRTWAVRTIDVARDVMNLEAVN